MAQRPRHLRWAMLAICLGMLVPAGLYLKHRPLLLRDSALNLEYTFAGTAHHDGRIYRSLFSSPVRFIHLPQAPKEFQWFGYRTDLRLVGQGPLVRNGLFGLNCTHPPALGIELNDPKLEAPDAWKIEFSGDEPSFSSRTLAVIVSKQAGE